MIKEADNIEILLNPYPFQAMLSITNDIDNCSWDLFNELHAYFNTSAPTQFGKGLNIEVGNSFWFFQNPQSGEKAFSYFEDLSSKRTKYAERIRELNKRKFLDCLHTWGNFSDVGGFNRKYAELAINECLKYSIKCPIWINHGDRHNVQNMIRGLGDDPESCYYTADLLKEFNCHYIWAGDITKYIGQDRDFTINETYFDSNQTLPFKSYIFTKLAIKLLLKGYIFSPEANALLKSTKLRDSQVFDTFTRYGNWEKSTFLDLPNLLSQEAINVLLSNHGKMSVYVHCGKKKSGQCNVTDISNTLKYLAELFHQKTLLICTTSRLLDYSNAIKHINVKHIKGDNKHILYLSFPDLFENDRPENILNGISFKIKRLVEFLIIFKDKKQNFKLIYDSKLKSWIIYKPWRSL